MFIDLPAAVLLLTPVFVPLAQGIGMDMTQLGIMMVVNLAIGLYTPPVGTTLFITSALAKVKVGQTVRELGPFYLVAFGVLALVSYVPASILKVTGLPTFSRRHSMTTRPQLAKLAQTRLPHPPLRAAHGRGAGPGLHRPGARLGRRAGRGLLPRDEPPRPTNPNGKAATASCCRTATTRSRTTRR